MGVTCVLNACQTHSECGSDACVIELITGLYRRIQRITEVYGNNIEIHDSDSRISMIPTEIPSVVDVIRNQLRTPRDWFI